MYIKKCGHMETTSLVETEAPYIKYHNLEKTGIVHNGFSTRVGGVSSGIFSSMNFSHIMGDSMENVRENFNIFLGENDFINPVLSHQTHTVNVRAVTGEDIGKGIFCDRDYSDVDGLITNERKITLVTSFADCVPLYFVDTENRAIGLSHSGWRGTVGRIGEKTIEAMKLHYNTKPENIVAAIGPSICVNCYEVTEDVAEEFQKKLNCKYVNYNDYNDKNILPHNMDNVLYKKNNGRYMLNLWAANYKILINAGVLKENISIPDICTCCNKEILFSHRGHMGKRGNMCGFLMIK